MSTLAWGGYANGQIPQSQLVQIGISPVLHVPQYLEAGAAKAFFAFDREFYRQFGRHVDPVEGYRSLARQRQLRAAYLADPAHEALAAVPGTSNHGYARAVDMGSGIASSYTPEARWARANGPRFGFWPTGYGFAKVEPWHYDWRPGTATASLDITPIVQEDSMAHAVVVQAQTDPHFNWIAVVTESGELHEVDPANRAWWADLAACYDPALAARPVTEQQYKTFVAANQPKLSAESAPTAAQIAAELAKLLPGGAAATDIAAELAKLLPAAPTKIMGTLF